MGKSTLFNCLTRKRGAESANYPFCTIDPNIGIVPVPDVRVQTLGKMYNTKKITEASIEFVDIAGLVKGASKGEGLGNQFLANIREVDAIVHVVRCFDDDNIIHVEGSVDPIRDIETINLELLFADMEVIERRYLKVAKQAKANKELKLELEVLEKLKKHLESGEMAGSFESENEEEEAVLDSFLLLTRKPVIYAANVSEDDITSDNPDNGYIQAITDYAKENKSEVFLVCAAIEEEIADLSQQEREEFLEELGIREAGLDRLISASYRILGLISFLTAGEDECRAWTITNGTKAPGAAGKIHSDFERGFIRAEVVEYDTLIECGSVGAAKEKGLVRSEGKDYIVKDGDIILFRFNV